MRRDVKKIAKSLPSNREQPGNRHDGLVAATPGCSNFCFVSNDTHSKLRFTSNAELGVEVVVVLSWLVTSGFLDLVESKLLELFVIQLDVAK